MSVIHTIFRSLMVLLFIGLGAVTAFSAPLTASLITYFQAETTQSAIADDVGFAARAPLIVVGNVEVTGGFTVMQGSAFASNGHVTVASLFDFSDDLDATNGGVVRLPEAPPPPTGNFNTVYPRGPGAAEGALPDGYTYVSRWVSPQEARMWLDNQGTAVPSAVGDVPGATIPRVFVTQQFEGRPPGATGTIRIDFAAPESMMHGGTGSSTGLDRVIFQPATSTPIHNVQIHVPDGVTIPD